MTGANEPLFLPKRITGAMLQFLLKGFTGANELRFLPKGITGAKNRRYVVHTERFHREFSQKKDNLEEDVN